MIEQIVKKWYYFLIVIAIVLMLNFGINHFFGFNDDITTKSYLIVFLISLVFYVFLGIYCFQKSIKAIILFIILFIVTYVITPILILLIVYFNQPSGPFYHYYSTKFYMSELYSITDFKMSDNSEILAKSDSIYAKQMGDYEHRLFFVMKLSSRDLIKLKKNLNAKGVEKRMGLRKDELIDSFFMVEENNPIKGLKAEDFKATYDIPTDGDDSYIISFHKDGKRVLFILNHV